MEVGQRVREFVEKFQTHEGRYPQIPPEARVRTLLRQKSPDFVRDVETREESPQTELLADIQTLAALVAQYKLDLRRTTDPLRSALRTAAGILSSYAHAYASCYGSASQAAASESERIALLREGLRYAGAGLEIFPPDGPKNTLEDHVALFEQLREDLS